MTRGRLKLEVVLSGIRVRSALYGVVELGAPWGASISAQTFSQLYVVTQGRCWITFPGHEETIPLEADDVVLLPRVASHVLRDHPSSEPQSVESFLRLRPAGSYEPIRYRPHSSRVTKLTAVSLYFEGRGPVVLGQALPRIIALRGALRHSRHLDSIFRQRLVQETNAPRDATPLLINHLVEVALVEIAQLYFAERVFTFDPAITEVLNLMMEAPEEHWTVESLASRVDMSRASFSGRFTSLVGEPPLTFLTKLRMSHAARMLRTTSLSVVDIANAAGYDSSTSFIKTFKKHHGLPPGRYRQQVEERILDEPTLKKFDRRHRSSSGN